MGNNHMCLKLYKNGSASGRKRREAETSIAIPEAPKGCNVNEECSDLGVCSCVGMTDPHFPQLCMYDREYPQQYRTYARKRMFLIYAAHSRFNNHNNRLRSGEVNPEFLMAKRRFFRLAQIAIERMEQDIDMSGGCKKIRPWQSTYTPVFQELNESFLNAEEEHDFCEIGRNLIYSMKGAAYRYQCGTKYSMRVLYILERQFKIVAGLAG